MRVRENGRRLRGCNRLSDVAPTSGKKKKQAVEVQISSSTKDFKYFESFNITYKLMKISH